MLFKSEIIKKYLHYIYNIDEYNEITLSKVDSINISNYNYKSQNVLFFPEELKYLYNLNRCKFSHSIINDYLLLNIKNLNQLKILDFSVCDCDATEIVELNITKLILDISDDKILELLESSTINELMIKDVNMVDVEKILKFTNLISLKLYNSKIINVNSLIKFENLEYVEIIGCELENEEEIKLLQGKMKVVYSKNHYYNVL